MKRITIKDIAKMANVTPATVSMVLNNKAKISAETRQKILDLVREYNYVPNLSARGLVHSKTNTIGVLISGLSEPINAATIKAVTRKISNTGYDIILYGAYKGEDWRSHLYHQLNSEGRLDGILHKAIDMTDDDREIVSRLNIPLVVFENDLDWIDCVSIDNNNSVKVATRYLLRKGHKKIGAISCSINKNLIDSRVLGVANTMQEHGLQMSPQHIYTGSTYSPQDGVKAADYFHSLADKPTAVFVVCGDYVAAGFLSRIKMLGYKVPDDFAIIGFDDLWFASLLEPQLTTIRQPLDDMVDAAIDMLIARIQNNDKPVEKRKFELEFILRQSA
jgi:LacI family transcriptional regulator